MNILKKTFLLAITPTLLLGCSKSDNSDTSSTDDNDPKVEISLPYFTDFKDAAIAGDSTCFLSKGMKFYHGKIRDMSTLEWLDCVSPDGTVITDLRYTDYMGYILGGMGEGLIGDLSAFPSINKISVRMLDNCSAPKCTRISACDGNTLVAEVYHSAINHDTTFVLDIGGKKLSYLYIGCGEGGVKSISIE